MARVCRLNKSTVIEAIRVLEKKGMLSVKRGEGKGNIYILTPQSSWITPKLPTDRSSFPTGRNEGTKPVGNRERKVIQEGNLVPAVRSGEVINNQADRIAAIFKRRKNTPWSEKEVKAWKKLTKKSAFDDDELTMVERYYAEARRKADNYCRRDLYTFLNNYAGEVDRARTWCEKHPLPGARKVKMSTVDHLIDLKPITMPDMSDPGTIKFVEDFERHQKRLPAGWSRVLGKLVFQNGAHK